MCTEYLALALSINISFKFKVAFRQISKSLLYLTSIPVTYS
jgi:hypothetical protein